MKNKKLLLYFDLRKYGFIEQNYSIETIGIVLQSYHTIISSYLLPYNANIYQIQTDTALYEINNNKIDFDNLINSLIEIKKKVIESLKNYYEEINLGLHCVYNEGILLPISIQNRVHSNICGNVMNDLQRIISFVDQSNDDDVINGIIISEEIYKEINDKTDIKSYLGTNFFIC